MGAPHWAERALDGDGMSRWKNLIAAQQTDAGWCYVNLTLLGHREAQVMDSIARHATGGKLEWGALRSIARATGICPKQVWATTRRLRAKFGVPNRNALVPIAQQLRLGGRGRSSNQASKFATVFSPASAGANATRTEALHPGTAPSRAL